MSERKEAKEAVQAQADGMKAAQVGGGPSGMVLGVQYHRCFLGTAGSRS